MKLRRHVFILSCALACGAAAQPAGDIRQGLVAYWPLDTTDGLTTPDLSPFGRHLNAVNIDGSNLVPGVRSNAMSFNGLDELLTLVYTAGEDNGLPVYSARKYTVALWVKGVGNMQPATPSNGDRRVFSEGSTTSNNPLLNIGTDNANGSLKADIFIRNDANTTLLNHAKSANDAFDDNWHHIAWVEEDGLARLYIDGVLDVTVFNYPRTGTLTLDTVSIGGIQRAAQSHWFAGLIDDVALWERALSPAEVQQIRASGLETPIPELPPLLTFQPVGGTRALGDRITLSVRAAGNRPFSYQWFKNDVMIDGATAPALTLANLTTGDSGSYKVRVENLDGIVTSDAAMVSVAPDPPPDLRQGLLSHWPFNEIADTSSTPDIYSRNDMALVNPSVDSLVPGKAGNGEALSFDGATQYGQRVGGFPIYNNPVYSVSLWVKANGIGQADLRILSEGSSAADAPLFTLGTATSGGAQTLRLFIRANTGVTLLTGDSTRPVFDDEWHHLAWVDNNGAGKLYVDGVLDETDFVYVRSEPLSLDITAVGAVVRAAVGFYFAGALDELAVWNRALTFTEVQAIIDSGIPPPIQIDPPMITRQPAGSRVFAGEQVALIVEATGTGPLAFQWRRNNVNILDATNSTFMLPSAGIADTGLYSVVVTNRAGSVTSDPAQVSVEPITGITTALVAHWPFEEANGITPDASPNANHLTLLNMDESNLVPGRRGKALLFNGTDELAERNHAQGGSIDLPIYRHRAYTIALWVKGVGNMQPATPNNGDRRVFSEASTTSNTPLLNLGTDNANGSLNADIYIRTDGNTVLVNHRKSLAAAFDGNWHHLAWVDRNGMAELYVDGVPDSPAFFNYSRGALTPNTTSVGGIVRAARSHWFAGCIDDVALWRRGLSEAEVQHVMNYGPVPIRLVSLSLADASVTLTISVPDSSSFYCVEDTSDPTAGPWNDLGFIDFTPLGNGLLTAQLPRPPGSQRFYRVYHCP